MEQEAEQDDPAWEEEEAEPSLTHKTEPSSRQWKQRRMLARLFGISIGCVVPLLLSFLALGRHGVFRGPVASAKVLIEGDAVGSADIEVLRETMRSECWVAQGGAVPTQHDCSLAPCVTLPRPPAHKAGPHVSAQRARRAPAPERPGRG